MTDEAKHTIFEQMSPYAAHNPASHVVAPGRDADHERGVVYYGPWEVFADGFAEHTRRSARALAMAGVPVHLRSRMPTFRQPVGEEKLIDEHYSDLLNASIRTYSGQIHQTVPIDGTLTQLVVHRYYSLEQQRHVNDRKVIYTVWERFSGLDAEDAKALSAVGQVWVGCNTSANFLKEAGVAEKKIRVVPCPYLPSDPHLALAGRKRRPGPPRFYHIGKWEPRKEQRNIIGAFLMAFEPGEAMLLLKTSERAPFFENYPTGPAAAIGDWLNDDRVTKKGWNDKTINRGVFLLSKRLSTEQMVELHKTGDVYLTLSRGEGMDMPALDAKLAGNLMVYTPSGGPQEFANVEDFEVPQTGLVPAHPFYKWHKDATYLDYDLEAAVEAMREAAEIVKTREPASPDRCVDSFHFAAEHVGRRMASYLKELDAL